MHTLWLKVVSCCCLSLQRATHLPEQAKAQTNPKWQKTSSRHVREWWLLIAFLVAFDLTWTLQNSLSEPDCRDASSRILEYARIGYSRIFQCILEYTRIGHNCFTWVWKGCGIPEEGQAQNSEQRGSVFAWEFGVANQKQKLRKQPLVGLVIRSLKSMKIFIFESFFPVFLFLSTVVLSLLS